MRIRIPGDPIGYYGREREKYNDAFSQYGTASPEEQALMAEQVKAVQQALDDRKNTRSLILAQMGYKVGPDGKSLVPLTADERKAIMSEADKSRSSAATAYQDRAKAAATGTTKLPSFLKKDIDVQKTKEEALLGELLGPEALNSTAGKQAIEALRKKEEEVRQRLQDQDLAFAPGQAMGLSGQLENTKRRTIEGYESLPQQQSGLIAGRGSLLQQMQQKRLDALKQRYAELEGKRQRITSAFTLGGTVGGSAIAAANQRKSGPETTTNTNYGAPMYDPYSDKSGGYYIDGKYYDSTY